MPQKGRHSRTEEEFRKVKDPPAAPVGKAQALHSQAAFILPAAGHDALRQSLAHVLHPAVAKSAASAQSFILQQGKGTHGAHLSSLHDEHAVGHAFKPVQPVIHHQYGHAAFLERAEPARKLGRGLRIEVGRRLVEHESARLMRENGRKSHLLLLALGKLMDGMMQQIRQSEGDRLLPRDGGRQALPFMHEGQFILHAESEKLLFRILKERARHAGDRSGRHGFGIFAAHKHPALQRAPEVARTKAVGETHEGRLSAAALPGNKHQLAGAHAEIDVAHGGRSGKGIGVGDIFKTYHDLSPHRARANASRTRKARPKAHDSRRRRLPRQAPERRAAYRASSRRTA